MATTVTYFDTAPIKVLVRRYDTYRDAAACSPDVAAKMKFMDQAQEVLDGVRNAGRWQEFCSNLFN